VTLAIVGYVDRVSARPGDRLRVMVSCETGAANYTAQVVRLICGDDGPGGPGYKERAVDSPANGEHPGRQQPIHAGSYVVVRADRAMEAATSFTLQALVWPTTPGRKPQTLLSRWRDETKAGFALGLDAQGALTFTLGDGSGKVETVSTGAPLLERCWYLVAASYTAGRVRLLQEPLLRYARDRRSGKRRSLWHRGPQLERRC